MRRLLNICFLAGILVLCLVKGAASPISGTWEGAKDGVKAARITIRETGGILGGSVIFYIVRDEGSGAHNGAATPAMPMVGTQWDGRVLRFSVVTQDGRSIDFELRKTGEDKGELRRTAHGEPEMTVPMQRAR